jgi:hypothetical protein
MAHDLGGHGEERSASLPLRVRLLGQLHPGLVDERRGLQAVVRPLVPHVARGQVVQLVVDKRRGLLGSLFISVTGPMEQTGEL